MSPVNPIHRLVCQWLLIFGATHRDVGSEVKRNRVLPGPSVHWRVSYPEAGYDGLPLVGHTLESYVCSLLVRRKDLP